MSSSKKSDFVICQNCGIKLHKSLSYCPMCGMPVSMMARLGVRQLQPLSEVRHTTPPKQRGGLLSKIIMAVHPHNWLLNPATGKMRCTYCGVETTPKAFKEKMQRQAKFLDDGVTDIFGELPKPAKRLKVSTPEAIEKKVKELGMGL